ncbi:hypothetical protein [Streptomyces sp. NPDC008139]|uniref:hypothetical protein n=1 Tax=Streptomyces sp. NPDC008139 TaxID=3364814 RepID=UPI0036E5ECCF
MNEGLAYMTVSAGMLLARKYLVGRGVDQDFADRYGSAYGRTAAKLYRTDHGTEPRKAWSNVNGRWRRVNGYLPAEAAVLDKAFVTYPRTAEYVVTETDTTADEPIADQHRIPGCDGRWHHTDGGCVATVAEMPLGDQGKVYADLVALDDEPVNIVVYNFDLHTDDTQGRFTTSDEVRTMAARYRAFADALDASADLLPAAAATQTAVAA